MHVIRPGRIETTMDGKTLLEQCDQFIRNNCSKFHVMLLKNLRMGPKLKLISDTSLTGNVTGRYEPYILAI